MNTTHIYLAQFTIETQMPIAVGTGETGLTVNRLIARDSLNLPYIPGTSLAGVIRHEMEVFSTTKEINQLFGFQLGREQSAQIGDDENIPKGQGSRISFSNANLVGEDGKTIIEGLQKIDSSQGYYSYFQKLPERDHVRITHKGTADIKDRGKFDEELVHKGTRFAFSIELAGTESDKKIWHKLLDLLHSPLLRFGAGTRKGFGKIDIISCHTLELDLTIKDHLCKYLDDTNSLNRDLSQWNPYQSKPYIHPDWIHYKINLKSEDFFLFGAGFGDGDVDSIPKTEFFFDWSTGKPVLSKKQERLLIPASSIKGALSHRVAFHYNRLMGMHIMPSDAASVPPKANIEKIVDDYAQNILSQNLEYASDSSVWDSLIDQISSTSIEEICQTSASWKEYANQLERFGVDYLDATLPVGEANKAVRELFGYAKKSEDKVIDSEDGARGNVLLSDVYLEIQDQNFKVFSHVAIDRFTGGARDGALFQQRVSSTAAFTLVISILSTAMKDEKIKLAFKNTLDDLVSGKLSLGSSTNKGHGRFSGKYEMLSSFN